MNKNDKITKEQKHKIVLSISVILLLCIGIAVTIAWFVNSRNFTTVSHVLTPSDIIIVGEEGKDITEINLEYTDADIDGDTITVKRVVCVKSIDPNYYLELAQTTNIDNLSISIYPASQTGKDVDNYSYDSNAIPGRFLNAKDQNATEATASGKEFDNTYYEEPQNVQENAIPLYWLSDVQEMKDIVTNENLYHLQYFVIVASWEESEKETDLIYLLASNNLSN